MVSMPLTRMPPCFPPVGKNGRIGCRNGTGWDCGVHSRQRRDNSRAALTLAHVSPTRGLPSGLLHAMGGLRLKGCSIFGEQTLMPDLGGVWLGSQQSCIGPLPQFNYTVHNRARGP